MLHPELQNDRNAIKDIVTEVAPKRIGVSNVDLKQHIASGQPYKNITQRDDQQKKTANTSYCLEALNNCTNYCRYGSRN